MPLRADVKHLYTRAAGWPAVRRRTLERAGGRFDERGKYLGGAKCEQCKVPDREFVARVQHYWQIGGKTWWRTWKAKCTPGNFHPSGPVRFVHIILTVAHLNHTPGDDRDENLAALCQWCHLHYDAAHHKETRSTRKDATRPLLAEAV